ncbi:MAG TPA: hypothetical protein VNG51_10195 [Ktedonobacteraceae bacterium]|nr:hypothetical protein [Ktedonobacteraceae bacterium]
MSELTQQNINEADEIQVVSFIEQQGIGKMTVLEALAEETSAISPNRSNISTRVKDADPDDA